MPKDELSLVKRIEWSIVSKAALRSRRERTTTFFLSSSQAMPLKLSKVQFQLNDFFYKQIDQFHLIHLNLNWQEAFLKQLFLKSLIRRANLKLVCNFYYYTIK